MVRLSSQNLRTGDDVSTAATPLARDNPRLVWAAALIVAALGAYIMFDAVPGLNWGIWTAAASVGLPFLVARDRGTSGTALLLVLATAVVLAAGTGVTADQMMHGFICLAVMLSLALAMVLRVTPRSAALPPCLASRAACSRRR